MDGDVTRDNLGLPPNKMLLVEKAKTAVTKTKHMASQRLPSNGATSPLQTSRLRQLFIYRLQ